jgi:hypothetical protein
MLSVEIEPAPSTRQVRHGYPSIFSTSSVRLQLIVECWRNVQAAGTCISKYTAALPYISDY